MSGGPTPTLLSQAFRQYAEPLDCVELNTPAIRRNEVVRRSGCQPGTKVERAADADPLYGDAVVGQRRFCRAHFRRSRRLQEIRGAVADDARLPRAIDQQCGLLVDSHATRRGVPAIRRDAARNARSRPMRSRVTKCGSPMMPVRLETLAKSRGERQVAVERVGQRLGRGCALRRQRGVDEFGQHVQAGAGAADRDPRRRFSR